MDLGEGQTGKAKTGSKSVMWSITIGFLVTIAWVSTAVLATHFLPGHPAALVAAIWVYGALLTFFFGVFGSVMLSSIAEVGRQFRRISPPDALSLTVAALALIPVAKDFPGCPMWLAILIGLVALTLGVILASNQQRMKIFFNDLDGVEASGGWRRGLQRAIAIPMGFTRDRSSLVAMYVSVTAILFIWPDDWPSWTFSAAIIAIALLMETYRRLIAIGGDEDVDPCGHDQVVKASTANNCSDRTKRDANRHISKPSHQSTDNNANTMRLLILTLLVGYIAISIGRALGQNGGDRKGV